MNRDQTLSTALDLILAHQWQRAHELVQDLEDPIGCRIHGLVHRIEGDLSNARYWYNKAGATLDPARSVEAEVGDIRKAVEHTG
jgi:hypothetical protein